LAFLRKPTPSLPEGGATNAQAKRTNLGGEFLLLGDVRRGLI